tara:strand:+ start:1453 stop:1836 length:384 start_codon:yes stop_codon:yes gene_type:complete
MKAKEFIKEYRDIDPLDDPNRGMDKDFKQEPMFNQLGKILDSQGNPNPLDTVITDDGKKYKVTARQADTIRKLMTSTQVKPMIRSEFTKAIQNSETLSKFLETNDMVQLFKSMYLGAKDGQAEPGIY